MYGVYASDVRLPHPTADFVFLRDSFLKFFNFFVNRDSLLLRRVFAVTSFFPTINFNRSQRSWTRTSTFASSNTIFLRSRFVALLWRECTHGSFLFFPLSHSDTFFAFSTPLFSFCSGIQKMCFSISRWWDYLLGFKLEIAIKELESRDVHLVF